MLYCSSISSFGVEPPAKADFFLGRRRRKADGAQAQPCPQAARYRTRAKAVLSPYPHLECHKHLEQVAVEVDVPGNHPPGNSELVR